MDGSRAHGANLTRSECCMLQSCLARPSASSADGGEAKLLETKLPVGGEVDGSMVQRTC